MTYNVLTGGRDAGSRARLEAILSVIEAQRPDILALQECNFFEADGHEVLHWFERRLEMRGLLAPADSGFHVALFVRGLPVISHHGARGWCQHATLRATVALGREPLELFSVHHDPFSPTARVREAEYIAGRSRPEGLQLALGDFNAVSPIDEARLDFDSLPARYRVRQTQRQLAEPKLDGRSIAAMLEAQFVDLLHERSAGFEPTVPTELVPAGQRFEMRIDHVFASRRLARHCTACFVVRQPEVHQASDHYPVVADFDLS